MRNLFLILPVVAVCLSCKSKTGQTASDSTAVNNPADQSKALIEQFKPIIQGSWVNKEYIEAIAKTKSPLLAFAKVGEVTTIDIADIDIKGDTLKVDVGYGNHEGGKMMLKFNPGSIKGAIIAYDALGERVDKATYELKYFINKKDTTLTLYTFDGNKKLKDSTNYIRAVNDGSGKELGYGTYFMENKLLIAGTYTCTDTLNNTSKIIFNNDGKVTGFPAFKTYYILDDFMTPPNNLDQLIFDHYEKATSYAFKITKDTLNLYLTTDDKDSVNLDLGKRVYKLVRQK